MVISPDRLVLIAILEEDNLWGNARDSVMKSFDTKVAGATPFTEMVLFYSGYIAFIGMTMIIMAVEDQSGVFIW